MVSAYDCPIQGYILRFLFSLECGILSYKNQYLIQRTQTKHLLKILPEHQSCLLHQFLSPSRNIRLFIGRKVAHLPSKPARHRDNPVFKLQRNFTRAHNVSTPTSRGEPSSPPRATLTHHVRPLPFPLPTRRNPIAASLWAEGPSMPT